MRATASSGNGVNFLEVEDSVSLNSKEEMKLEKVIGLSSKGQNAIEINPVTGDLVYLAGSFLVVYSPKDSKQSTFLSSRTSRPFLCCQFSNDGKYLAAGEYAFKQPQITIWEVVYEEYDEHITKNVVAKPEIAI